MFLPSFAPFGKFIIWKFEIKKMIITVESAFENSKIPEWGLLEFQGHIFTKDDNPMYGELIGDLNYTNDGVPFFIIGRHILFGEEITLRRPFGMVHKERDEETNMTKYLVKAVIKKKIVFKKRPKPIICHKVNKNNG